jgi:hypothetical protein
MDRTRSDILSAQVVVKRIAKRELGRVMEAFRNAGYSVGPAVANNFSITGPASLFRPPSDSATVDSGSFVLSSVHPGVRDLVESVVFPERPAFGPGADV